MPFLDHFPWGFKTEAKAKQFHWSLRPGQKPQMSQTYVFSWPKSSFRVFGSMSQKHPNELLAQFNNIWELFHFNFLPSCILEESISGSFSLISSKYYWVILLGSISGFSMSDYKPRCYKLINLIKMQLSKDINFIGCV